MLLCLALVLTKDCKLMLNKKIYINKKVFVTTKINFKNCYIFRL